MTTINIEDENEVSMQDDNLHLLNFDSANVVKKVTKNADETQIATISNKSGNAYFEKVEGTDSYKVDITAEGLVATKTTGQGSVTSRIATLDDIGDAENDVIEGYLYNGAFYKDGEHTQPITGFTGKIYIDLTKNEQYRFENNSYIPLTTDVSGKADKTQAVGSIELSINSSTYVVTLQAKNVNGQNVGTAQTIDLPLESVVVNGSYNNETKKVILTLQNGSTVEFSVADLVAGLQSEITNTNKLSADLVDDTNAMNKFVTNAEKTSWNNKQDTLTAGTGITIDNNNVISATDQLPSHTSADVNKVLTVDSNNDVVWDYTKDEIVTFTKTNSSGTFAVTSAEWVSAMNNDKAILRVTDGTDYYVLYKVKYDATTVYFQGDGKEAQFIKDGVNYSGTFGNASGGGSTLIGTTDPTTATVGEVGQFYLNTITNKLFQCQSAGGGSYTWGVPNVNAITLGTETQTFAGGKTLLFPTAGYNLTLAPASSTSTNVKIYPSAIHATYGQRVVKVSADNEDAHIAFKQMSSDPDLVLTGRALGSKKTITLPNKTGTVALTSDIPTLDNTPTENSQNAVTSGGVYSALALKQDTMTALTNTQIDTIMDAILV